MNTTEIEQESTLARLETQRANAVAAVASARAKLNAAEAENDLAMRGTDAGAMLAAGDMVAAAANDLAKAERIAAATHRASESAASQLAMSRRATRIVELEAATDLDQYRADVADDERAIVIALREDDPTTIKRRSAAAEEKFAAFNKAATQLRAWGLDAPNLDDFQRATTSATFRADHAKFIYWLGQLGVTSFQGHPSDAQLEHEIDVTLCHRQSNTAARAVEDFRFVRAVETGERSGPNFEEVNRRDARSLAPPVGYDFPVYSRPTAAPPPTSGLVAQAVSMFRAAIGGAS